MLEVKSNFHFRCTLSKSGILTPKNGKYIFMLSYESSLHYSTSMWLEIIFIIFCPYTSCKLLSLMLKMFSNIFIILCS
jgi:hypothetical protein